MIKNKEVNSILWSGIERFSAQGAQFLLWIDSDVDNFSICCSTIR